MENITIQKEKNDFFSRIRKKDRLYSLLLSNPNLRISWDYDGDIPEGFVDFCLKNFLKLNSGNYKIFQSSKKIKDYPEDVRILVAEYIEEISGSKLPKEHIVKILRAYKNSVLKYGSYVEVPCLNKVFLAISDIDYHYFYKNCRIRWCNMFV